MARSSRRLCLAFGEDVARVECGLLYAMNLLTHRKKVPVKAVRDGLKAAKEFADKAPNRIQDYSKRFKARDIANEIVAETKSIDEELEKKAANGTLAKRLEAVRKKTLKLRKQGMKACGS